VADHPKLPGYFSPYTLDPTLEPQSQHHAASSPKEEETKTTTQSPSLLSSSHNSFSTTNLANTLNPGSLATNSMSPNQFNDDSSRAVSLKLFTEKLNNTNFSMWCYNLLNSLAYYNLYGYIQEHTPDLKSQADYKAKQKVTTFI
jgi:hypothetical protein